jgi:A/G-specific adenine glycosylase
MNKTQQFFTESLLQWNATENKRQMPWKGEKDPYRIWLSEIILQQTRVEQGWNYYLKFLHHYPTIHKLATAPDDEVMKHWEGLGYYSRCRNLLKAARQVVHDYNGVMPQSSVELARLPGIGPYTAAAIASFAFGEPSAVVDGNVVRILSRFFGVEQPWDTPDGKKRFTTLATAVLPAYQPAAYNQAIMDFGATVCKPIQPACHACALTAKCFAYKKGRQAELPARVAKAPKKQRYFVYAILTCKGKVLVRQRQDNDVWKNLYEFYLVENDRRPNDAGPVAAKAAASLDARAVVGAPSAIYRQALTHQLIEAWFVEVKLHRNIPVPGYRWVAASDIGSLAFPGVIRQYLAHRLPQAG